MRQSLGRGLDALIVNTEKPSEQEHGNVVKKISIDSIRPSRFQPRKIFDPEKLSELAQSIKESGLAQPIIVSHDEKSQTYELISGERRLRASQLAGLSHIDSIVKSAVSDRNRLAIGLIENIQREDLNPVDAAMAYLRLINDFKISQIRLSEVIGKSRAAISNTLRLLDLPEEIQNSVRNNQISEGHARALLTIKNSVEIINVFREILASGLSVRNVETMARTINRGGKIKKSRANPNKQLADVKMLEEDLQRSFATKVDIKVKKDKNTGSIRIHFFGLSDFDRIMSMLRNANPSNPPGE